MVELLCNKRGDGPICPADWPHLIFIKKGVQALTQLPNMDEEAILRVVQAWPREQQIHLAHRLLDPGLETLDPHGGRPNISSADLRGIGAGGHPAPSDEDIERWRLEKYGA